MILNEQTEKNIEKIEAVISELIRNNEDLSDVVAAQNKEISKTRDRLHRLLEREFELQNIERAEMADKPPPHW